MLHSRVWNIFGNIFSLQGGAVASCLVRSTPDRAIRVRDLAGDIALCSWARHFTLTVSTQVYKWLPANLMLGVSLRWTSMPSRGGGNRDELRPGQPLGSYADFTLPLLFFLLDYLRPPAHRDNKFFFFFANIYLPSSAFCFSLIYLFMFLCVKVLVFVGCFAVVRSLQAKGCFH